MNPLTPVSKIDIDYKSNLKHSLTEMFKSFVLEIHDVMDSLGESRHDYHLSIYPFSIERVDGQPVPKKLLLGIQERLKTS